MNEVSPRMMAAIIDNMADGWDYDAWLAVAESAAQDSPCNTKIGAVLVNPAAPFPVMGCNAPPPGFVIPGERVHLRSEETVEPVRTMNPGCQQYCKRAQLPSELRSSGYTDCPTVHAEMSVLIRAGHHTVGAAMFVNGATCMQCAKTVAYCRLSLLVCRVSPEQARARQWPLTVDFLQQCGVVVATVET